MSGPLAGIRILDLSTVISGPMATWVLADQGADVIKIEQPGVGDVTRQMGKRHAGIAAMFLSVNRGKRSVTLDLSQPRGVAVFRRLARQADVVVQNFRPGAVRRMGVDYDTLREENPDLVYASISGFGDTGPYAARRVYDPLVQAAAGFCHAQAGPGEELAIIRTLICDKATAMMASQAITAALFARERGHGGQHVKLNMLDCGIAFLWPDGMWNHTFADDESPPIPNLGDFYRITKLADADIIILTVSDQEFAGVCRAYGRGDLAADERYSTLGGRMRHAMGLVAALDAEAARWKIADLVPRLEAEDVPFCIVNRREDLYTDPQVRRNRSIVETDMAGVGRVRLPKPPAEFDVTAAVASAGQPVELGAHTDEVLVEAGYDAGEIADLRNRGLLG